MLIEVVAVIVIRVTITIQLCNKIWKYTNFMLTL